jgi:hypothetical protein
MFLTSSLKTFLKEVIKKYHYYLMVHDKFKCLFCFVISSSELKAQVSYSDHLLSIVHLSVSVNFYIFNFFSRTTGPILTRHGTNHPWGEGFQVFQMKGIAPLQGEIIAKV